MTVKKLKEIIENLPDDTEIKLVPDGCGYEYVHDWWIEDGELILG